MKSSRRLRKILISHRGEIVRRIQSAARARGIDVVVVYTRAERHEGFVQRAQEAYCLQGEGGAAYCDQDDILEIARISGVDGIHPGYGFLSENYRFAQRVIDAGLVWIGPSPDLIRAMGDKVEARRVASSLGVPVIPGVCCVKNDDGLRIASDFASCVGYPLILKDPWAGGGKAMRMIYDEQGLFSGWDLVCAESGRMGGAPYLLLEKVIEGARHIEVQIVADGERVVHLYERECSMQRRHQKIIEEAPACFIAQTIKNQLYDAAVRICQHLAYEGVGTVEFLVVADHFYFLEMNTRLQVEHSVTEAITGIDLVDLQLQIARGDRLEISQASIPIRGHALECRIYAEDPTQRFLPSTGTIIGLEMPRAPHVRIDCDVREGSEIGALFDPMIAKMTVWRHARADAIAYACAMFEEMWCAGVVTNIPFLVAVLTSSWFVEGEFTTDILHNEEVLKRLINNARMPDDCLRAFDIARRMGLTGETQQASCRDGLISLWKLNHVG